MSKDSAMGAVRHELFENVYAHAFDTLKDHGIPDDLAEQCACAMTDNLADNWGGQNICIPKDHTFKIASRDQLIWDDFKGSNHSQLARKYNLTVRRIYKIIKRFQESGDPNQLRMF